MLSPGSRKPARAEYILLGQAAWRPTRHWSPFTASMITTGSVRGKCSALQDGHTRFQPPSATSEGWPQTAQWRCRRRHSNIDLAVANIAGLCPGHGRGDRPQILETSQPIQRAVGRIGGAVDIDGEYGGPLPQAQEQQALGAADQLADHASARGRRSGRRLPWRPPPSGLPFHSTSPSDSGAASCSATQLRIAAASLARSSGLPAKTFVKALRGMPQVLGRLISRLKRMRGAANAGRTPNADAVLAPAHPPRDIGGGDRRWAEASPTRSGPEGSSRNEICSGSSAGLHPRCPRRTLGLMTDLEPALEIRAGRARRGHRRHVRRPSAAPTARPPPRPTRSSPANTGRETSTT